MENDTSLNVQNGFFNQIRKDRTRVTLFLSNGQKISGVVKAFDKFTLLLDTKNGEQIVFKHAISTISTFRQSEGQAGNSEQAGARAENKKFGNFIDFEGKKET